MWQCVVVHVLEANFTDIIISGCLGRANAGCVRAIPRREDQSDEREKERVLRTVKRTSGENFHITLSTIL